jgi:hypothetical protein
MRNLSETFPPPTPTPTPQAESPKARKPESPKARKPESPSLERRRKLPQPTDSPTDWLPSGTRRAAAAHTHRTHSARAQRRFWARARRGDLVELAVGDLPILRAKATHVRFGPRSTAYARPH